MEKEIYRARIEERAKSEYKAGADFRIAEGTGKVGHIILTKEWNCHLVWWYTDDVGPAVIWVGKSPESERHTHEAIEKAVAFARQSYTALCKRVCLKQYEQY